MRLARAILLIAGAIYFVTGIAFLLMPEFLAHGADLSPDAPSGFSMIRSVQGGFQAGYGAFLLLAGLKADWIRAALFSMIFTGGGFVVGRITSIIVDGQPKTIIYLLLIQEIIGVLAAISSLYLIKKRND